MQFWTDEVMGNHGVHHRSLQLYTIVLQHHEIVFQVLTDLLYLRLIDRTEDLHYPICPFTALRNRHIPSLSFLDGKTKSYEASTHAFCTGGFRIKADGFRLE